MLALQNNHVFTSGATGTNAAVIRGALRAEKPHLLTVVLPQSLRCQPSESQELLQQVHTVCISILKLIITTASMVLAQSLRCQPSESQELLQQVVLASVARVSETVVHSRWLRAISRASQCSQ